MPEDKKIGKIDQKDNSMKKILILLVIIVSIIGNFKNLSNADKEKEIASKNNFDRKSDDMPLNIDMQALRILSDSNINTWTANNQQNPSISFLSNGGFVVVWQS